MKLLATSIAFIFASLSVYGQGFSFSEYYDNDDYNGFITVWDAVQDSNGYMYFAIGDGLVIYNGVEWNHIHIGETGRGTDLFISNKGQIYASGQYNFGRLETDSLNNQIYRSISDNWYAANRVNPHFATIEIDSSIYMYGSEGFDILTEDSLRIISKKNSGFLELIEFDGRFYAFNEIGIYSFDDNVFSLQLSFQDEKSYPSYVVPVSNNELLIGFTGRSPLIFDGHRLFKSDFERYEEVLQNFPFDAIAINEDQLAIATAYGGVYLYTTKGKLLKIFDKNNGLQIDGVYDLFLDKEKNLWLGTSEFIQKVNFNNQINHFIKYSEPQKIFYKLSKNGNEIFAQNYLNQVFRSELTPNKVIDFIETDFDGEIFQVGDSTVIYSSELKTISDTKGSLLIEEIILGIIENYDDEAKPIFVNDSSLIYLKNGEYVIQPLNNSVGAAKGIMYKKMIYLYDRSKGVFKVNGDTLNKINIQSIDDSRVIINDLEVFNDSIYIATEGSLKNSGIYVLNYRTNQFEKSHFFEELDSELTGNSVSIMKRCSEKELWVMNGFRVKKVENIGGKWNVINKPYNQIGLDNTVYSIVCTNNNVWFTGIEGVFQLSRDDWEYTSSFKTNITGVFVDQDSLIYGGFGEPVRPLILPYEDNRLRFTYAAASYIDESRNTYSIKLEGFDGRWSDWTSETQKDYTNIPEGEYIFKVRSRNVFEVEGSQDQIAFTVLPPWYRTWWAYLFYVIGFSSLIYTGHRIRLNQLLKVERMRTKIASDLHDEVSATLTGISYFAEALKTDQNEDRKKHFINLITESAGDAKEKITDIVWSITPENDDWALFLSKCRRYASDLFESSDIKYNLNITQDIESKLSMNLRQHLWMIFKEMITNAVRHSSATQVDVILDVEDQVLKLIVQDNGRGFRTEDNKLGNGLSNIKNRANELEAKLSLISEPEIGTRWRLELPL